MVLYMKLKTVLQNNLYMLKNILRYCPSQMIVSIANALLGSAVSVLNILLLKFVIDSITNPSSFAKTVFFICANAVVALLQSAVSSFLASVIIPRNTQILQQKMQMDMFQKAVDVELKCYEDSSFYNKFTMALQQAESRALAVLQTFTALLSSVFSISALAALVVTFEPAILGVVFFCVVISFLLNLRYIKVQHKYVEKSIPINREMSYVKRVFYLEDYAKELRYSHIPDVLKRMFDRSVKEAIELVRTYGLKFALLSFFRNASNVIGSMGIMIYLAHQVFRGNSSVGDFTALVSSSQQLTSQLISFLGTFPQLYEHSLYIEHYREFMEYQPQIQQNKDGLHSPAAFDLCIENVSFQYTTERGNVLKNISIDIRHKEKVAFVGHNGSGKTTLVKLITRLYDPDSGCLSINGKPYAAYQLESIREKIGVMFQDYHYFALSVAENVLLRSVRPAHRSEDEKIVIDALAVCGLYEKIAALPDGIYTKLTREFNEDGIFLSGGELQKLALARIYAKQCGLIILDEPSSALDPMSEKAMFDAMLETGRDKTVIMISHRLANIKNVDRIYLFEDGKVVEEGSHQELMAQNGRYAAMYRLQAEQYQDV